MLGETLLKGGLWFTQLINTMDHASHQICFTPSFPLSVVLTTYTGACSPSLAVPIAAGITIDTYSTLYWHYIALHNEYLLFNKSLRLTAAQTDSMPQKWALQGECFSNTHFQFFCFLHLLAPQLPHHFPTSLVPFPWGSQRHHLNCQSKPL